ncbi:Molybdopterin synthase/thiamin biosynthesis sulphur carrier, beta-grasp [Moorella glycerini]|uniref:Sulfur carrier protein ThiS n=1 Tax=Neomoorella stamsii TaxID=1266720 RepID=A0A9X7P608_9FIRM|nr:MULTISPECIES: sulfur carrier protein ThiS [Moorella]PRR72222.1 sulfur carrier protein ThiS [Moorella stamsii]CEP69523.1 Molybdopterin synthase/thiamin biosynthesis sulphur carrier, beta-grasp [Moorella glycerini]
MIEVWVNGKRLQVDRGVTVTGLLAREGLLTPIATVAVNDKLLPRQNWDYRLQDGDRVEVINLMEGG